MKTLDFPWFEADSALCDVRDGFHETPPECTKLRENCILLATLLATILVFLTNGRRRSRIAAGPPRPSHGTVRAVAAKKTPSKLAPGIPDHAVDQETLMRFFGPPIGKSTFYNLVRRGVIVKIKEVQGYYPMGQTLHVIPQPGSTGQAWVDSAGGGTHRVLLGEGLSRAP